MVWNDFISEERKKPYFKRLSSFLAIEKKTNTIYPEPENVFAAFDHCPLEKTHVILIGQDPYINPGQAQGLSFSVPDGFLLPPSLQNIFKELKSDLSIPISKNGNLIPWTKQGVLLLNSVLTVKQGQSNSHKGLGWEQFTDSAIKMLNDQKGHLVFLLWGSYARSKKKLIGNPRHHIIESVHPSPLSASQGFFGSRPFSRANKFLKSQGLEPINWDLG